LELEIKWLGLLLTGHMTAHMTPKGQTRDPNTLILEGNISKTAGDLATIVNYYVL